MHVGGYLHSYSRNLSDTNCIFSPQKTDLHMEAQFQNALLLFAMHVHLRMYEQPSTLVEKLFNS